MLQRLPNTGRAGSYASLAENPEPERQRRLVYLPPSPGPGGEAYNTLFSEALLAHNIVETKGANLSHERLLREAPDLFGIHVHFLQQLWSAKSGLKRLKNLIGFQRYCTLARRLGLKLIWTPHDLPNALSLAAGSDGGGASFFNWTRSTSLSDQRVGGKVNDLGFRFFAKRADLVIVHSRSAEHQLRSRYAVQGKLVHMPHGNFDSACVTTLPRDQTLAFYGLGARPVLGMVGRVTPARGHLLAIEAMGELADEMDLLILGGADDAEYGRLVEQKAKGLDNVVCQLGRLEDDVYANAVSACDLVLLPYTEITTSGALLSAWTSGRAVVATRVPLFEEMFADAGDAGTMIVERTVGELIAAVRRLLQVPENTRVAAARAQADRYAWDKVVVPVAEAIWSM